MQTLYIIAYPAMGNPYYSVHLGPLHFLFILKESLISLLYPNENNVNLSQFFFLINNTQLLQYPYECLIRFIALSHTFYNMGY